MDKIYINALNFIVLGKDNSGLYFIGQCNHVFDFNWELKCTKE